MPDTDPPSTTDHLSIRQWVERYGGRPCMVRATMDRQGCGRIEIGFDTSDVEMVPISWRRFFDIFEANQLAFCGQRLWTTEGHVMRLPKLVSRGPDLDLLEGPPVPAPELAATDPVV